MPIDDHVLQRIKGLQFGTNVGALIKPRQCSVEVFIEEVYLAVEEALPALQPQEPYTTELLIGPDLWATYSKGVRRAAGICLAKLVEGECLPLAVLNKKTPYPLRFVLVNRGSQESL